MLATEVLVVVVVVVIVVVMVVVVDVVVVVLVVVAENGVKCFCCNPIQRLILNLQAQFRSPLTTLLLVVRPASEVLHQHVLL